MAWPAPRRRQADFLFFLSSSTSVNSASTTSSALPEPSPPRAAPPGSPSAAAPSWACLYMASPSFIAACASALVLAVIARSEEHTSELQSHLNLVCRLLLEKKKKKIKDKVNR